MIAQIFVQEKVMSGTTVRIRQGLAFGDHPQIQSDPSRPDFDDREVNAAVARGNQEIRIIVDELLRGNGIEELACADGSFSAIPVGTDPDDIAKCAGADLSQCSGPNAVCLGADGPIGILDEDEDEASDDFRMIDYGGGVLAVEVLCDGISIPLDQNQSFYNPSGNQQIPAGSGGTLNPNGLGPVLVLVPIRGLRTSANCTLAFNAAVVDKDNNQICAPEGGDFLGAPCSPGDVGSVAFNVEPMELLGNDPPNNGMGVPLTAGGQTFSNIILQFNAAVDQATTIAITLRDDTAGADVGGLVPTVSEDDPTIVTVQVPGGYTADSDYTLTVGSSLTDEFGGALPAAEIITFSTAAPTPDAAVPDAALPDAS